MDNKPLELEEVAALAMNLSPLDKVRLLERLASTLEHDLASSQDTEPLPSLYGLWADLQVDVSVEDIDEARREMWGNFPREVIS
jgi:hypothetical protein